MNLYRAILKQYGSNVSGGIGSFSQFGFIEARLAVQALETITGDYTVQSVNAAFKAIKNVNTGMLCQRVHLRRLRRCTSRTTRTTPSRRTRARCCSVPGSGCLNISTADPQIAAVRQPRGPCAGGPDVGPRLLTVNKEQCQAGLNSSPSS